MHVKFEEYSAAVCRYVKHATGKERAAIRKELTDHMADHAQALLDGGFPEEHAHRVAVESMGDPEAVGKALNREYPLRWLVLSRLFLVLAVGGVLLVLQVFPVGLTTSLEARIAPMRSDFHDVGLPIEDLTPTNVKSTLPNGDVVWVYATAVTWEEAYGYIGHVYTVTYNRNPLRDPYYDSNDFSFFPQGSEERPTGTGGAFSSYGATYRHHALQVPEGTDLDARFNRYGTAVTLTIPLPWEEVETP